MKGEILEKPFESAQIKQRVGTHGNVLDYVEGHTVIQRLNDAFDGAWCFEILRHKILEQTDEVLVLGKLTAGDVVKCQFGSSRITRAKDTREIISLPDDLKAAGTDSLKKCATMLGVGLYLYNGDKSLHERNGETGPPKSDTPQAPGTKRGEGGKFGNGRYGDGRITNRQLKYAVNLGRSLGLNSKDLDQESVKMFVSGWPACKSNRDIDRPLSLKPLRRRKGSRLVSPNRFSSICQVNLRLQTIFGMSSGH